MIILQTKEPMFATSMQRKGRIRVYFDKDGLQACTNLSWQSSPRICSICGNVCIQFVVDDNGEYTCSACGKFPRELLLQ